MSWSPITEADLLNVLAGPELDAYRAAALASGQADPIAPTIQDVVGMVRGYVEGCLRNRADADPTTIPDKLKPAALDILAVRIPRRAAGTEPTETRADAEQQAIDLLKDVAACRFGIDQPASASTEQISAISPSISNTVRRRRLSREDGA